VNSSSCSTIEDRLDIALEPMRRRNLRAVQAIDRQVYPAPWSTALYIDELRRRDQRVYRIARIGGRIVGYGGSMLVHDEGHITSIAVDPAFHGKRIGAHLLLDVTRGSIDAGMKSMTLEVRLSNTAAHRLYRWFGYAPAGIRKGYYPDNREDALVMWCHDVQSDEHNRRLLDIACSLNAESPSSGSHSSDASTNTTQEGSRL
jgi:[ribosomal protein S18]-alanine N-acetyltransferase